MFSRTLDYCLPHSVYPMKDEPTPKWLEKKLDKLVSKLGHKAATQASKIEQFIKWVDLESIELERVDDRFIQGVISQLRANAKVQGVDERYLVKSFALIREMSSRVLGMRHYREQLIGGWAMMNKMVAEMETGQGKTLTATLPAASAALAGIPTHVITVNDYLAQRDAETMQPLYQALGLTVGVVVEGMEESEKRDAYGCDITYCTNKQIAFDHLRDRMVMGNKRGTRHLQLESFYAEQPKQERLMMRGLCFAIVDEADSVLVDEAITPLIISASRTNKDRLRVYKKALGLGRQLEESSHFTHFENEHYIELRPEGKAYLKDIGETMGGLWRNSTTREELVLQALKGLYLFEKDRHYLINEGKIQIIDEFTGRVMADRSWEGGLHQMIELKEGLEPTADRETLARISYQRFFQRYIHLCGMTGTAEEVRGELWDVYGLHSHKIPTAQTIIRKIQPDRVCADGKAKWDLVVDCIQRRHQQGQPILVGTRSVEASEYLSQRLTQAGLVFRLLNARQDDVEADIIAEAGHVGRITVATNMAGRGTDIKLSDEAKAIGGLHIVATERHESRRVDRQLFGRCGRQGDPGSVEVILSYEDDVVRMHCPAWVLLSSRWVARALPFLAAIIAKRIFHLSQVVAEHKSYKSRCSVLKSDEHYSKMMAFSGQME